MIKQLQQFKQLVRAVCIGLVFMGVSNFSKVNAQALTGSKTIPSTNFPTIKSAVDSLNAQGVGTGGVTFNITPGYTETTLATIALTATGTVTNPIVFQKDPLTSGANPLITAYVGTLLASSTTSVDGIWSFTGSDYVTIDGIDLLDPISNTTPTTTMEFGYGFFKASATDGANNNTIRNCTITLNRVNGTAATGPRWQGSVGIELSACTPLAVGTTIVQTTVAGASSNNKFYSNTIQNCNGGIALGGAAVAAPFTLADLNNDVGGNSLATGNTIINFGGGVGVTLACMAVWASNQWSFNISYNTINNNTGTGVNHGGTNRGIFAAANSPGASANINNNTITIAAGPTVGASNWNIDIEMAQSGANGNVINVNNNRLLNCTHLAAATSTVPYTAIWLNTAASTVNCNNNYIYGFTYNGTQISHCILSQLAGIGTLNINNNIIDSTVLGGTGVGTHNGIGITAIPTLVQNINGNTITRTFLNATGTGTKTLNGINTLATSLPTTNINDNLIDSISRNGTTGGTTVGILQTGGTTGTSTVNVRRNTVRNISISGTGTASTLNGIQLSTGTIICDSNTVFNLSCLKATGTGTLSGISDAASPTNETFSNNRIYNLTHFGTGVVNGLFTNTVAGTRLVTNNQVYSLVGNGGNIIGLSMITSSPTITRNRIYSLRSNGTTTGTVFGISLTTLGAAGSATIANNLIDSLVAPNYTGTADAIRGISSTITTAFTSLRIYYNTVRLSATTGGANFSSAALFFTGGTTASTATLDLRNNILINNSIANGTGNAVALRNSTTGISNYASTSNNNLFYAGVPSAANLIYHDGTNSDQTIAAFKARLATFEQASITENPTFISLNGASPDYLHLDLLTPTRCESGAANIAGFTTDVDNVIRQGNAGYAGTGSAPDIGADEGEFLGIPMVIDSVMVDQITAAAPLNSVNQNIVAIRVHASNSFNALNLSSLKLNTNGTTNVNDIQNARVYFTGNSAVFAPTNQYGSVVTAPNGTFYVSGSRVLNAGVNYFWVTYDVKSTATTNNFIDVRVDSLVIGGNNTAPVNGDPTGSRKILGPLAGNYNVGVGQTYPTITSAAADLTALGVSGPTTFILKDALYNSTTGEVFPIVFTNYNNSSSINTVTIRPDVGIISRVESANNIAAFDLNGISNLIIDGRQGGVGGFTSGNNLTIANTNVSGPAIRFINEASSNRILYTDLRSNNIIAPGTLGAGVVNFGTTTGLNGNDNNIIRYCDIHEDGLGNPTIGISSIGSATTVATNNDGNIIDSCNIYNFFHPTIATAGIYVGANNGSWVINANRLYQTATITTTGTQTHRAMWITPNTASLTSASGFIITNNFIGGNSSAGTGIYTMAGTTLYQFMGMDISVGIGTATSIQNNTITNMSITGGFTGNNVYGINIANGNVNVGTITGNLIGSTTTNGAITFTTTATNGSMIALRSGAGGTINFSNNIVSGIDLIGNATTVSTGFNGIAGSGGSTIIINNNTIGSTTLANSINMVSTSSTSVSASAFRGIICNSTAIGVVNTITNNIIANLNTNYAATGSQATSLVGIAVTTGTSTIAGNIIRNLTSATQTTAGGSTSAIVGLAYTSATAPALISGNNINNLVLTGTSTSAAVQCEGLFYGGPTSGTNIIRKNNIHSLSLNAVNPAVFLTAMDIGSGLVTISNNMIRLGYDSLGNSITAPCIFRGISKNVAITNVYFNSIYIGGAGVGTSATNTFAFQRTASATSDDVRNNIFVNARSNASTGGKHYQVFLINNTTITLNNNIYFGGGTGAVFGTLNNGTSDVLNYTSGWLSSDINSGVADPHFINAGGSAQTGDLHISSSLATPIEANGILISSITDDIDGELRSGLSPTDIGADAGNFIPLDIFAPVISAPITSNTSSTGDRILNINISDATGIPNTLGNEPKVYFKKSFLGTYNSTSAVRTSGSAQNGQWSFTIAASTMGGLSIGDSVYFYLVAQDSSLGNNLSSLPAGAIGSSVNSITTPPATLFSYRIVPGLSGNVNVGSGQTYTSLTGVGGLFEAVNNGSLNGNLTANITSDLLEDGTNGLNQINETGTGNYTLSIVPDGTTERLIVGNVQGAGDLGGLIRLNGADRVKIDGSFGGSGRFLRFRNRAFNTTFIASATFRFQNDAKLDTVRNCFIEGSDQAVGTILFGTTNVVGGFGNDSNAVINCVIRDTVGTSNVNQIPNTALQSQGTLGSLNDFNTFANNEIFNHGFAAVNLTGTTAGDFWNISNNIVYQVIVRPTTVTPIIFQIDGGVGHTISNNSIGGSNSSRGGAAFTAPTTFTAIRVISSTVSSFPTTISNNTISNISATGAFNGIQATTAFAAATPLNITGNTITGLSGNPAFGMLISGGTATITNNTLDTIVTGGITGSGGGIQFEGGAGTSALIQNNSISNFRTTTNATTRAAGISVNTSTAGLITINNNTIRNVSGIVTGTSTALSSFRLGGIIVQSAPPTGLSITNNTIENIRSTVTGTAAYAPVGILVTSTSANFNISRNRIRNIGAVGTGTGTNAPVIHGIQLAGSPNNALVANNQISLGDSALNQSIIMGISDYSTTANTFAYNTVFINGITTAGANNTYGFFRNDVASNVNLINNILYNKRTTLGTGNNYAVGALSNLLVSSANINYNFMVVNDTNRLIELPVGIANGWSILNTLYTTTYNTNWAERTSNVLANNLFVDTLMGNLGIVTSNPEAWFANGKGERIITVSGDYNNASGVRSTTIAGGATDIGSVEFTPTSTPPIAFADKTPAANDSTQFFFGSRMVAKAVWGTVGTLPSSVALRYFSGVNPPNTIAGSTFMNAYWNMQATGGSGYSYNLTLVQDSAVLGTVGSVTDLQMVKYLGTGTNWNRIAATTVNNVTGFMNANSNNTLGIFSATNGASNPLPVKLIALTASAKNNNVLVSWTTASEENNKGFEVESSIDGKNFKFLGFVKGAVNSNTLSNYNLVDANAFVNNASNIIYYRLKQLDLDGQFTYSKVVSVNNNDNKAENVFEVFPNPFNTEFNIVVNATEEGNATVETIDLQGKVLVSKNFNTVNGLNTLNINDLPNLNAGIYVVKVTVNGQTFVHKLVKN